MSKKTKFTQEELIAAWQQMSEERHADQAIAMKIFEELKAKVNYPGRVECGNHLHGTHFTVSPFPNPFSFLFYYSTYGNSYQEVEEKLIQIPGVSYLDKGGERYGLHFKPVMQLDVPEGKYQIDFEYQDHGNW